MEKYKDTLKHRKKYRDMWIRGKQTDIWIHTGIYTHMDPHEKYTYGYTRNSTDILIHTEKHMDVFRHMKKYRDMWIHTERHRHMYTHG